MPNTKKHLTKEEAKQALTFKNMGWSIGKVAAYFKTNKPSILKALDMWESAEQEAPDGRKYIIKRGQVYVTYNPLEEELRKKIAEDKKKKEEVKK